MIARMISLPELPNLMVATFTQILVQIMILPYPKP